MNKLPVCSRNYVVPINITDFFLYRYSFAVVNILDGVRYKTQNSHSLKSITKREKFFCLELMK